ncbi:MAG: Nif3-like dinuclear metal center hexameric protein [Bacteroidota bacterium]
MKLKQLIQYLEGIAPSAYQESYDNSGLLVGDQAMEISGVMCCLDSVEAVLDEAIAKGCNVVVAHHPIVFRGLKRLTGKNYVERVVLKAIKNDIALYAIHTNLDNVYHQGVNAAIAARLALTDTAILAPKSVDQKLSLYFPASSSERIRAQLQDLKAFSGSNFASLGVQDTDKASLKMEMRFPAYLKSSVLSHIQHIQKDTALQYEISEIYQISGQVGSGMIGELATPLSEAAFLAHLKGKMQVNVIKHTQLLGKDIKRVAVCGGAGGFLLKDAIRQQADIFITSDYKYHEFFDADGRIIIADIGHYESEQFTIDLLHTLISDKFTNFATFSTTINSNPVFYYVD